MNKKTTSKTFCSCATAHHVWSNSIKPEHHVPQGKPVELIMKEASDGQITTSSVNEDINALDPNRANPITGPLYIEGAEPGDALEVHIKELIPSDWGWTANIPGFGLLEDQFKEAALHHWHYDAQTPHVMFGDFARVPLSPFIGTIGVAPAEKGEHGTIPPRHVGGNLDLKHIGLGSKLILPVECEGALFSAGDPHAAQGDGEICGTAIETPMNGVFEFRVHKGQAPKMPRVITNQAHPSNAFHDKGSIITTGIGPDMMQGSRDAVSEMIDVLTGQYKMDPVQAYMLCSVAGDLKVGQIVDQPNWTMYFEMPRATLEF